MNIRPYHQADRDQVARIWSASFLGGRPLDAELPEVRESSPIFVAELDGRVAGCFRIHAMRHTLGGADVESGGVAAVGVSPDQRHLGVGKQMMRWALDYLKSTNVPFASLYAFSESYYRTFGYEQVGLRYQIRCKSEHLQAEKTNLPGFEIDAADWRKLAPCYHTFASKYNGMVLRDEWWWSRAVHKSAKDRHIFAFGDPIEAYAIVKFTDDFWVEQPIEEAVWSTRAGYEALQTLFRSIGVNRSHISWCEPSDGPFVQSQFDNNSDVQLKRFIMFRVLDASAALRQLEPKETGSFTLEIEDALLPSNCGPFRIEYCPDGVTVEPSTSADLILTDRAFSQAIMGQPSLRDLLRSGAVKCHSDAAAIAAIRLLRYRPVYCLDSF